MKTRILFTIDQVTFFRFYWFEMRGNDLYWGSSYKSARGDKTKTKINGTTAILKVPEDFENIEKVMGKYSYHESGIVHYKKDLAGTKTEAENRVKWAKKEEIKEPLRFFAIISKTLKHYDLKISTPTKGKANAIIFKNDENDQNKRMYLEFFITPPGSFQAIEPLIKIDGKLDKIVHQSLNDKLILIIRYGILQNLNDRRPDIEITIIPDEIIVNKIPKNFICRMIHYGFSCLNSLFQ